MLLKIKTHHKHPQGRIFSWMALILGLSISISLPVFPNFVKSILNSDSNVSIFYSAMALVALLAAILSTIFFQKIKRTSITKISLFISAIFFVLLIFVTHTRELTIINTVRVWFLLYIAMAIGLFVRDFAKSKNLGKEEGKYYKFSNIGYLIGPLLGGFLAARWGYEIVFILTALFLFICLLYFHHQHIVQKHPAIVNIEEKKTQNILSNIKEYFKDTGRIKAYFVTFIQMMWIGFKRLYAPLYIAMLGYNESMTGIIFSLGIIPFILLEVKVGEYADKKGVRIPFSLGFLIIAIGLLLVFISPYPILNFALIILCSIGAAFVEPLQEYYLFKHLPEKDEENMYGVYMTADPISYFIMPLMGALILAFLPFKYLFLIFGIIFLLASGFVWAKVKNS